MALRYGHIPFIWSCLTSVLYRVIGYSTYYKKENRVFTLFSGVKTKAIGQKMSLLFFAATDSIQDKKTSNFYCSLRKAKQGPKISCLWMCAYGLELEANLTNARMVL